VIVPVQAQAEATQPVCFIIPALLSQQIGQPRTSVFVADADAGAEPVEVAMLGQQVSEPPGSKTLASVGSGA